MDSIEFEKVSVAEARAVLKDEQEALAPAEDWRAKRDPLIPDDMKLQQSTIDWVLGLPQEIRPLRLARKFPRIANKLASVWKQPSACDKVLDELLIDHRGSRQGFPHEVALEISSLKTYYTSVLYVRKDDIWTLA